MLSNDNAIWAADQFIQYYSKFNRIDDYLRYVKGSRITNSLGKLFGPEDEIFSNFDLHPNDMSFTIHEVDTDPKPKSKYNQDLYAEILNETASNAIEEAIPGRTVKWMVVENTTKKIIGVVRFGSPTINSKPRNNYFGEVLPLSVINEQFVMGFNIVPVQPFGYNYLGGKLLALLASSNKLKRDFDKKYGTNLKYFETTSLYGTTKGMSMYDGLKPYLRHVGDTESKFLPLFHDDYFREMFWWFNDNANGGERLISADKSSKKLKIQVKMISIIKKSLKDQNKLDEFNACIENAKSLTEKKRFYLSKFGYEPEEVIDWWKKKASKRYEKLKSEGKLRTELELWKLGSDLEIIR
ncbi:DUF4338 domain-containing protein [bacterium]|nr:DUF4338 domain-containing protein [bacterium]